MNKDKVVEANEITLRNIQAYMERVVTKFGSGAKVDCPKEFLGKKAYLIIEKMRSDDLCPRVGIIVIAEITTKRNTGREA